MAIVDSGRAKNALKTNRKVKAIKMQIEGSHLTCAAAMEGGKQPNMALK